MTTETKFCKDCLITENLITDQNGFLICPRCNKIFPTDTQESLGQTGSVIDSRSEPLEQ